VTTHVQAIRGKQPHFEGPNVARAAPLPHYCARAKGVDAPTPLGRKRARPAGRDEDVLLTVSTLEAHRRQLAASRTSIFPEFFAGCDILAVSWSARIGTPFHMFGSAVDGNLARSTLPLQALPGKGSTVQ
jgi:hypothetical protein